MLPSVDADLGATQVPTPTRVPDTLLSCFSEQTLRSSQVVLLSAARLTPPGSCPGTSPAMTPCTGQSRLPARPSSPPEASLIPVTAPRPACHKVFQATLHNFSSWPDRELLHSEGCYGHTDWHHLPLSAPALRANTLQTSDSRSLVCAPRSSANTGSCWTSRRGFYESQMR